jgi:hypothetical protein
VDALTAADAATAAFLLRSASSSLRRTTTTLSDRITATRGSQAQVSDNVIFTDTTLPDVLRVRELEFDNETILEKEDFREGLSEIT